VPSSFSELPSSSVLELVSSTFRHSLRDNYKSGVILREWVTGLTRRIGRESLCLFPSAFRVCISFAGFSSSGPTPTASAPSTYCFIVPRLRRKCPKDFQRSLRYGAVMEEGEINRERERERGWRLSRVFNVFIVKMSIMILRCSSRNRV
jgi:hypothetical protein